MRTFIAAAIVGLSSLPSVIAWGAAGHEVVATLAQSHLDPQVLTTVCSILGPDGNGPGSGGGAGDGGTTLADGDAPCYLATVATWADKIRFRAHWSAPLHYAEGVSDHPPDDCQFPGTDGWSGADRANVLDAIQNVSSILTAFVAGTASSDAALEALKFLIHFAGDMHQPLHLCGRDRGGNGDKVHWDGRVTNLHSVWDNALIAKAIRLTPANYSDAIPAPALESSLRGAIYDPYVRRIYWEGLGADQQSGRWGSEADSWLTCPPAPSFEFVPMQLELEPQPQEVLVGAATAPRRKPRVASGPPATSDSDTLCPYAWAAPIQALNCGVVWPAGLDNPQFATEDEGEEEVGTFVAGRAPRKNYLELDTPEYSGQIEDDWIIEKLLMQAGVRLAGILNAIFAPQQ